MSCSRRALAAWSRTRCLARSLSRLACSLCCAANSLSAASALLAGRSNSARPPTAGGQHPHQLALFRRPRRRADTLAAQQMQQLLGAQRAQPSPQGRVLLFLLRLCQGDESTATPLALGPGLAGLAPALLLSAGRALLRRRVPHGGAAPAPRDLKATTSGQRRRRMPLVGFLVYEGSTVAVVPIITRIARRVRLCERGVHSRVRTLGLDSTERQAKRPAAAVTKHAKWCSGEKWVSRNPIC